MGVSHEITPWYSLHMLEPYRRSERSMELIYPKPFEVSVGGLLSGETIYGCSGTGDSPRLAAQAAIRNVPMVVIETCALVLKPLLLG